MKLIIPYDKCNISPSKSTKEADGFRGDEIFVRHSGEAPAASTIGNIVSAKDLGECSCVSYYTKAQSLRQCCVKDHHRFHPRLKPSHGHSPLNQHPSHHPCCIGDHWHLDPKQRKINVHFPLFRNRRRMPPIGKSLTKSAEWQPVPEFRGRPGHHEKVSATRQDVESRNPAKKLHLQSAASKIRCPDHAV
ncbi:hypothetical protein HPB51_023417 [Rhipicephalus microplus]|uniref:Uncharacterized protein n=1 Tax=Rhipicephalus microplus TaxID=6941 RepID=A0A9J6DWW3_RHIMP|nr:hypothetical protein HPB51_023417 [Rhipicephalus microplus]